MLDRAPRILFLSLSNDVGTERIVSEMGRRGALCAVIGRPRTYAALSRFVVHHHVLPSRGGLWGAAAGLRRRLEWFCASWRPDAIVPLDDMASQLLRDLALMHGTREATRALILASLGDPRHLRLASSRAGLVETAAALGLRTPAQVRAATLSDAAAGARRLGFPLLVKRESSCGGGGVTYVRDEAELASAFRKADRKGRAKRAVARLFGFRAPDAEPPVSLQAFVSGRLAIRTVACADGRVLDGVSLLAEVLDPPLTGSSTVVSPIRNDEMSAAAATLVGALGASGFVSFDFLVDDAGRATLIEMNPRPVGSGHLGARFGHDLYGAWLDHRCGIRAPAFAKPADPACRVALFPKEMRRDPGSAAAAPRPGTLHDVPWDEPQVVAAYRALLLRRHPGSAELIARRLGSPVPDPAPGVVKTLTRVLGLTEA